MRPRHIRCELSSRRHKRTRRAVADSYPDRTADPLRGESESPMSSYISAVLIFLLTLSPVLIPAAITAGHALGAARKHLPNPAA